MFAKQWKFTALLLAVVLLLAACSPTATPESDPTEAPTEVVTEAPVEESTDEPTEEADATEVAEPTGPLTITPPEEPAVCEMIPDVPAREVDETDWVKGAEDAEITIIEYADFQCPGCSGIAPALTQFLENHPEARLVYRHFPLSFHDKAMVTAAASEAAGAQGKFWEMYDLLFSRAAEWGSLTPEEARDKMSEYAEELDLDLERFDQELDDDVYAEKINAHYEEAVELGLPGTPTFIFNGQMFPTEMGLSYNGLEAFLTVLEMEDKQVDEVPEMVVDAEGSYEATLKTSQGDIVVELLPESAPTLVNSFIYLAEEGWYDDADFFFVQDNFVALAGDPSNTGFGHPGYYCMGESQGTFDRSGLVGILPNGQFFITLGLDASSLTGQFALIGQVTEGLEVAEALARTLPGDPSAPEADVLESIAVLEK